MGAFSSIAVSDSFGEVGALAIRAISSRKRAPLTLLQSCSAAHGLPEYSEYFAVQTICAPWVALHKYRGSHAEAKPDPRI
jgi:hypothetical protein